MKPTTQTERIIRHFLSGKLLSFITAFYMFEIQDLRKRLSEVRRLGYRLHVARQPYLGEDSTILPHWGIAGILHVGDYVSIDAPPVLMPSNTHPLKGKVGCIARYENHKYLVVSGASGAPLGWFQHKDLRLVGSYQHGQAVKLSKGRFTIGGISADGSYYLLKQGNKSFFADPVLLRPVPAPAHATH